MDQSKHQDYDAMLFSLFCHPMMGSWCEVLQDDAHLFSTKASTLPIAPLPTQATTLPNAPLPTQATTTCPIAPWIGRLVFSPENRKPNDAVSIELEQAPEENSLLVGKTVTLTWDKSAWSYVDLTKRNVHFSDKAIEGMKEGNVMPTRLDGLVHVGPLESLAGARAENDMHVILSDPVIVTKITACDDSVTLEIAQDPVQVTGTSYMAAAIRRRISDRIFHVQHYNAETGRFDGEEEIIEIPSLEQADGTIVTPDYLEDHYGSEWYVYGDTDERGVFIAKALESVQMVSLRNPDEVIVDKKAAISYINKENWKRTPIKTGTCHTALLDPASTGRDMALEQWKEGDRCLVIHLFGGRKGIKTDRTPLVGAVTGHFAYGVATVVRDDITNDLRFDIDYSQVYSHNKESIISGRIKRSSYVGDFYRGWLGRRPISDIVVKLDIVTKDYKFGSATLSPMDEFVRQLDIMMARYRVGDGTGASVVTPSRSCVQDSNQALYVALKHVEDQRMAKPEIDAWLKKHTNDPETLRYRKLQKFGRALKKDLVPMGIVRADWKQNEEDMVGVVGSSNPLKIFLRALVSWKAIFPRRAHDEMAKLVLKHGGKLWFIRTNQIGMTKPGGVALAPTTLFGVKRTDNEGK